MRGRYWNAMAMVGVIGMVASACGSDDSSADVTPTVAATQPASEPATTEAATTEPPTTEAAADDLPLIVATTTIWADVVDNVVCGNLADVVTVVPAGSDSHQYEPSLQDRGLMGGADLLVVNGLFLEEGLLSIIEAVESEGVPVFAIAEAITDLIELDGDDGHDDDHGGEDPHVWFDPARVASSLPMLGDAIVDATGIDAATVAECVAVYQAELLDVDAEMAEMAETIDADVRKLVTTHESLGYLADRYDFEVIGTVLAGISSMAETNPADLEDLANEIIAAGVPAIFAEVESSADDIEALAARIGGVSVVELRTESLGAPGSGADTYVSFLRSTATTITEALTR